ncbi:MAG: ribosomal protein S18-alanine N-acetyltransferase [Armatimonadota bacterium]
MMTQLVKIEQMQRGDVQRIMEIEKQCFTTPWHESAYLTELVNRSAYYVVGRIGDKIVGYSGMWIIMDEAHITTIGVDPEYRGRKIGEQILIAMLEEAQRRGAGRATLEVRESNDVAQNLYRKYGFVPAAIRRGYYSDNNENAIIMWVDDMFSRDYQDMLKRMKQKLLDEAAAVEQEEDVDQVAT